LYAGLHLVNNLSRAAYVSRRTNSQVKLPACRPTALVGHLTCVIGDSIRSNHIPSVPWPSCLPLFAGPAVSAHRHRPRTTTVNPPTGRHGATGKRTKRPVDKKAGRREGLPFYAPRTRRRDGVWVISTFIKLITLD